MNMTRSSYLNSSKTPTAKDKPKKKLAGSFLDSSNKLSSRPATKTPRARNTPIVLDWKQKYSDLLVEFENYK